MIKKIEIGFISCKNLLVLIIISMEQTNLFEFISNSNNDIPIVLIDKSGSTATKMSTSKSIMKTFADVIQKHIQNEYHLMFWSDKCQIIDDIVTVSSTEAIDNVVIGGQTDISVAFKHMPSEWLETSNHIYILTDGDINRDKYGFASQIKSLTESNPNIKLHIISVEANNYDYSTQDYYAGNKIYKMIKKNKLTNHIKNFFSYNNMYTSTYYINLCNPDYIEGFIPFEDKYFPITKTSQFIRHIEMLARNDKTNIEKLLHAVAMTVYHLVRNKPTKIQNDIIDMFCDIFVTNATISYDETRKILCTELSNHQNQTSTTFQEYKTNRAKVFSQANKSICADMRSNISCCKQLSWISIPIETNLGFTIFESNNNFGPVKIRETTYLNAGINIGTHCVPVFPKKIISKVFTNQCLRQWIRAIYSHLDSKTTNSDIILYKFLGLVLKVYLSDIDDSVKSVYIDLALVMLDRKRYQSGGIKEIDHLLEGNPPLPVFDNFEKMADILTECGAEFGIGSYTYWYAIIMMLGNPRLIQNQKKYCLESLTVDGMTPDTVIAELKSKLKINITLAKLITDNYEYYCYVSMDDTTLTGGFAIPPHLIGNHVCSPKYVVSEESYLLLQKNNLSCPICYTDIDHFDSIGPKADSEIITDIPVTKMFDTKSHQILSMDNFVNNTDLILIDDLDFTTTSYDIDIPHFITEMNPYLMVKKTKSAFLKEVSTSCGNFLLDIDMTNVCVAGGFCRSILLDQTINDIDLFFYGLGDNEIVPRFKKLITDIAKSLGGSYLAIYKSNTNVFELLRYTTIGSKKKTTHKIQIILVSNVTMQSILEKFDLDSSKVIFDGVDIYFDTSSYNSYKYMINIVNEKLYTNTYDHRLKKYFDYGFAIVMPELNLEYLASKIKSSDFDDDDQIVLSNTDPRIKLGGCIITGCELVDKKIIVGSFCISQNQDDCDITGTLYNPAVESDVADVIDTTLEYINRINVEEQIINHVNLNNCDELTNEFYDKLFGGPIKFISKIDKLQYVDWYGSFRKI